MLDSRPWPSGPTPERCRFGDHVLDVARGTLCRPDGAAVTLRPKTAEVLRLLCLRVGSVVTRDDLMRTVWPNVFVTDDCITQSVAEIRQALGKAGAMLLRTLPRRGYMLAADPVEAATAPMPPPPAPSLSIPSPAERPSLAVLPFVDLGRDPAQAYLADGLTEELTTALSRLCCFVVARNTAFALPDRADARRAGTTLGVGHVLEGSVQRAGARLRIACRLVEVATGHLVWADRFEGDIADLFALQDRVTEAVAGAVEPSLRRAEVARVLRKPTGSLSAYDLYLRALPHHHAATRADSEAALELLRRAVALDPGFTLAQAFAARCLARRTSLGCATADDLEEGIRLARAALAAHRDDPATLQAAARALAVLAFDHEPAAAAVQRAAMLNPYSAEVQESAGAIANWRGLPHEAIPHFERAIRLSPLDPEMPQFLAGIALAHLQAGHAETALTLAQQALWERPDWIDAHRHMIMALWQLGRPEAAAAVVRRFREVAPAAARVMAQRVHGLFRDAAFAERRVRAMRDAGLPE